VQRQYKYFEAYQTGHPGAKVGTWVLLSSGVGGQTPEQYKAYLKRIDPLIQASDYLITEHYHYGTREAWHQALKNTVVSILDYDLPWIVALCPMHMAGGKTTCEDFRYFVKEVEQTGAHGVLIWGGMAGLKDVSGEMIREIEALAAQYK